MVTDGLAVADAALYVEAGVSLPLGGAVAVQPGDQTFSGSSLTSISLAIHGFRSPDSLC